MFFLQLSTNRKIICAALSGLFDFKEVDPIPGQAKSLM
jgi:hypothetical protein